VIAVSNVALDDGDARSGPSKHVVADGPLVVAHHVVAVAREIKSGECADESAAAGDQDSH
jgi:hypothetical protein